MTAITLLPARLWHKHPREVDSRRGRCRAARWPPPAALPGRLPGLAVADPAERDAAAPPAPPPLLVRDVAPEQALDVNQKIPLCQRPQPGGPAVQRRRNVGADARARALDCLTSAAYYEAGNESDDGIRAVAQVVLNRVRHPAFPSSVCGVVYQGSTRATGCQFTFTCDGSLIAPAERRELGRARQVAEAALCRRSSIAPVGWATHYHANYVLPYWAPTLAKNAVVGAHLFYRWSGGWGRPGGFTQRYSRKEPNSTALRATLARGLRSAPGSRHSGRAEQSPIFPAPQSTQAEPGRVAVRFSLEQLNRARQAADKAPASPMSRRSRRPTICAGAVARQEHRSAAGPRPRCGNRRDPELTLGGTRWWRAGRGRCHAGVIGFCQAGLRLPEPWSSRGSRRRRLCRRWRSSRAAGCGAGAVAAACRCRRPRPAARGHGRARPARSGAGPGGRIALDCAAAAS